MADVRQHRTVEQHAVAELDQQGGEVLDFLVAEQFGVLLDIDQANTRSGMASASASSRLAAQVSHQAAQKQAMSQVSGAAPRRVRRAAISVPGTSRAYERS